MPGPGGIDVIIALRGDFPAVRIIVLTTYGGDDLARRALGAGAQAYILKNSVRKDLLDTIRAVHKGLKRVQPEVTETLVNHMGEELLTPRELVVLKQIAAGKANKSIAYELSISEETVKGHVKNILGKLHANDRTPAVALGVKRGIITILAPKGGEKKYSYRGWQYNTLIPSLRREVKHAKTVFHIPAIVVRARSVAPARLARYYDRGRRLRLHRNDSIARPDYRTSSDLGYCWLPAIWHPHANRRGLSDNCLSLECVY